VVRGASGKKRKGQRRRRKKTFTIEKTGLSPGRSIELEQTVGRRLSRKKAPGSQTEPKRKRSDPRPVVTGETEKARIPWGPVRKKGGDRGRAETKHR